MFLTQFHDLARVRGLLKHFEYGALRHGMAGVGSQLAEGNQHEFPLRQALMGNRQLAGMHNGVFVEQDVNVHGPRAFEDAAAPAKSALIVAFGDSITDGARSTSETNHSWAALLAGLLRKAGVKKGDHVGLLMENSALFVIAFFAVQRLGAAAVVFNTSNTPRPRELAVFGDPLETIWKNCIFGLCGRSEFFRRNFEVVVTSTPAQRAGWLREVQEIVTRWLKQRLS